jgi:glycine oxidase
MSPDVIVVGGGVIGSAITYWLVRDGARVDLYDRGDSGQATRVSAGLLAPHSERHPQDALGRLARESAALHPRLAAELRERTGIDAGYRATGLLRLAMTDDEERGLRAAAHEDGASSWLARDRLLELEPAIGEEVRGAVFSDESQVSPAPLARSLQRAAAELGASVHQGTAVDTLEIEGSRVSGVHIGSSKVPAEEVVLATGAWTAAWQDQLKTRLPLRPVRGQMVLLESPLPAVRHILFTSEGYLALKAEGHVYVGATQEEAGFDARATLDGITGLLALARRIVPALSGATVLASGAGLRPATPDGMPLIGRLPGWAGISVAAGHFRNGILLAPITAELMSDLLAGRRPRLAVEAFDPARFLVHAA